MIWRVKGTEGERIGTPGSSDANGHFSKFASEVTSRKLSNVLPNAFITPLHFSVLIYCLFPPPALQYEVVLEGRGWPARIHNFR